MLGILTEGDRVTGVSTSRGPIHAPRVVNAAGLWGARVGAMVGLEIPISVCRHKISIVSWPEAASGPHPMVYDFVTNIYTRPELGGHILVGGLEPEEALDLADPDRYREGVSLDESTEALSRVSRRFPVLATGASRAATPAASTSRRTGIPSWTASDPTAATSPSASPATASSSRRRWAR